MDLGWVINSAKKAPAWISVNKRTFNEVSPEKMIEKITYLRSQ